MDSSPGLAGVSLRAEPGGIVTVKAKRRS